MNKVNVLFSIQSLDAQIVQLKRAKAAIPKELEPHQKALDQFKHQTDALQNQIKDVKLTLSKGELGLGEADERIKKLTIQSNLAKKNDEYQILMKEINQIRSDKSVSEDGLIGLYSKIDEIQVEIKKTAEELQRHQSLVESVKKEVEGKVAEVDEKLGKLTGERQELAKTIDREILKAYERIQAAKPDGIALAEVIDEYCQGCHMSITSQDINLVMMGKDLISCKACSRILYIAETKQTDVANKA